jgi:hypothetical protein
MSQEIGHVTLSHGMSLVVTLSRDCPTWQGGGVCGLIAAAIEFGNEFPVCF